MFILQIQAGKLSDSHDSSYNILQVSGKLTNIEKILYIPRNSNYINDHPFKYIEFCQKSQIEYCPLLPFNKQQ